MTTKLEGGGLNGRTTKEITFFADCLSVCRFNSAQNLSNMLQHIKIEMRFIMNDIVFHMAFLRLISLDPDPDPLLP